MASLPLGDPEWSEASAICPSCGYSLAGIEPPIPCPECGLLFTGKQLIVCGVPSAGSVMSPVRVAAAVILSIAGMFIVQLTGIVWITAKWYVGASVLGVWLLGVIAMVVTGPRVKGGKCRFLFVEGGVNVVPMKIDSTKAADVSGGFRKFVGDERIEFKRVSPVWAKLRLERSDGAKTLDAGIRCPVAMEAKLIQTLERLVRGEIDGGGDAAGRG